MRNSMSNSLPTANQNQIVTHSVVNTDVQATVATMRWAAACVDISPLALPSPERELTDPMRGVTAAIPGSHSQELIANNHCPPNASSNRKSRLTDFWQGTTDIDHGDTTHSTTPTQLVTNILASTPGPLSPTPPVVTYVHTNGSASSLASESPPHSNHSVPAALLASAPPASVPALANYHTFKETDYFGDASPPMDPQIALVPPPHMLRDDIEKTRAEHGTVSVPALPRRVCLTRQTSSPLPVSSPPQAPFLGARLPSNNVAALKLGRAAKEEQMFTALEYLAPPNPVDELERRRALYK